MARKPLSSTSSRARTTGSWPSLPPNAPNCRTRGAGEAESARGTERCFCSAWWTSRWSAATPHAVVSGVLLGGGTGIADETLESRVLAVTQRILDLPDWRVRPLVCAPQDALLFFRPRPITVFGAAILCRLFQYQKGLSKSRLVAGGPRGVDHEGQAAVVRKSADSITAVDMDAKLPRIGVLSR